MVTTYGSAETCGGCVYDGEPLDGVEVRIGEGELEGRILLGGDTVAAGYLDAARASKAAFFEEDGVRWYVTGDLGELDDDGRLTVLGRADDVIITGGVKASAALHPVQAGRVSTASPRLLSPASRRASGAKPWPLS